MIEVVNKITLIGKLFWLKRLLHKVQNVKKRMRLVECLVLNLQKETVTTAKCCSYKMYIGEI